MRVLGSALALLLLAVSTDALSVSSKPKNMNNHKCKVMCQRFGMKALGPEFAQIHNPTECCTKCDSVYKAKSLLQVAAVPVVQPSQIAKPATAGAPVKR